MRVELLGGLSINHAYRRSLSTLEVGYTYLYNGLVGQKEDTLRLLTVLSISVTGMLQIRLEFPEEEIEPSGFSLPYDLALQLIKERIWQECTVKGRPPITSDETDEE